MDADELPAALTLAIPSALSLREHQALRRYALGNQVVEAGALLGASTITLGQAASRLISVDTHMGYTADTWAAYKSNLLRAGVAHRVMPIRGEAVAHLPKWECDFTFIDLTGQHGLTLAALQASRSELVAVHDYQRQGCTGVESALRAAGVRLIEVVDTLAIGWRRLSL